MKRSDLIALLSVSNLPSEPDGVTVVRTEQYAAILSSAGLPALGRRRVLRGAAERARLLEALLPYGTVIPVLPGLRIRADEIPGLVAANRPLIDWLAGRLFGRVQYQVTVQWRRAEALAHFVKQASDRAGGLDQLADALRANISARLEPLGEAIALPVAGDVLSNTALLIDADSEPALDRAVESIDALWSEGFAIRMVGPYPGVSFASLAFRRIERRTLEAAQAALGVTLLAGHEELRAARRSALMAAAPKERDGLRRQADLIEAGLRLPQDAGGPLYFGRVWSEDRAAVDPSEVDAA